jgi:hypothetical protein
MEVAAAVTKTFDSATVRASIEALRRGLPERLKDGETAQSKKMPLKDFASQCGLPLSTAHAKFGINSDGSFNDGEVEHVARCFGLTPQDLLDLGAAKNSSSILKKAANYLDRQKKSNGTDFATPPDFGEIKFRFNSETCVINQNFAQKTGLWAEIESYWDNGLKRGTTITPEKSIVLTRGEIVEIVSKCRTRTPVLALAQSMAVGKQRSKLSSWRTFDIEHAEIESVLVQTDRLLIQDGPVKAFSFLVSDYAGLPGVGASTASFYLYLVAKASGSFDKIIPAPVPFNSISARTMSLGAKDKVKVYGIYLERVSALAEMWHVEPDLAEYWMHENPGVIF